MQFVCSKCKRDLDTPGNFCPFCGTPAPQPGAEPEDPYIGRTIAGKYFVNQCLGRGGMGSVYKATHLTLDRAIALKVLHRSFLGDASMVQRFHREARAASRLNQPNCINVLDFGEAEDGSLFIAMEYLGGRSLSQLLADESPLGQRRVVHIVSQILSALAEAHGAGIIHRDLKLSNVMVEARRDEPDFVKVLDFGIAKLADAGEGSHLTGTGMVCGTPGYMSPEQARGEELDARSDLYATGVVLYELLTGRLPFDSNTPMGFVAKHMAEIPVSPRERRPDLEIAPVLDELVMRTLAKEREARPQSAEAMRAELLAIELPPDRARPPTPRPGPVSTLFIPASPQSPVPSGSPPPPSMARFDAQGKVVRPPTPGAKASPHPSTPAPAPKTPVAPSPQAQAPNREATPSAHAAGTHRIPAGIPSPGRRGPGRTVLFAAGGAGVVLLAVVGYLIFGRDPFAPPATRESGSDMELVLGPKSGGAPQPEPTPPPAEPPPPPPVEPAPPPVVEAPPPPVVQAPPPPPPPKPAPVQVAPPPPPPPPKPAPAPVVASPAARPSAPAPPQKGSGILQAVEGSKVLPVPGAASGQGILLITASPWAVVYVDGKEIGETPRELRVGAGFYRVRLVHPTLGKRETTITVPAGRRAGYNVNLAQ